MNLAERINRETGREVNYITDIIKNYFTGHEATQEWSDFNDTISELEIQYNIVIENKLYGLNVTICYDSEIKVMVSGFVEKFDNTVTGYLEQTIKRELTNKEK